MYCYMYPKYDHFMHHFQDEHYVVKNVHIMYINNVVLMLV
jgi:hypothetical protein